MNMPIQAAPIDRANRSILMAKAKQGVMPSDLCDTICGALPFPMGAICKIVCPRIAASLGG
ncbi:hypothetical protein [Bauldia sp.]|uniref:hypothetical protein n=1 Tax=Bauldia sp. TaxID=2575872 RepID=UPI003BABB434